MPIHVNTHQGKHEQVTVIYGGEKATVSFAPDAISNRDWRFVQNRPQTGKPEDPENSFNVAVLSRVVVAWDLRWSEKDKDTIPVTKEEMDKLPARLLNAILQAIMDSMFPNLKPAGDSGSFS